MVITRRCNLSCGYCNESDRVSPPVPIERLKRQVEKLSELGTFSLTLTGGEPLLHPDIFDLIRYSKKHILRVEILTNGFLLTKEKILKLNSLSLDGLQISIDGANPNKTTVKVLKHLKDKLILLKRCAAFAVNINAVIGSTDPEEALEVIDLANELGLTSTIGLIHDSDGQINLTESERKKYYLANKLRRGPFWDIHNFEEALIEKGVSPFKCRAGSRYLYVDEFGSVHWCSQQRGIFQKLLMDYSFQDLKTQFYRYKECLTRCTVGCARRASSLDGWRRQAE
jgi:MoaA/NifB/PqqE/SkfB family radical SAM enzyme